MRSIVSHFTIFALALGAGMVGSNQIQAGLMPVGSTVTASGSNSTYSYSLGLTSNSVVVAGDYFTIYDFAGLVPNSNTQPTGFTFSSSLVGPTPAGTTPVDSPAISNITWTFNGLGSPVGPTTLGNFAVQSQFGMTTTGSFASLSHILAGDGAIPITSQAQVTVPSGSNCGSSGDPVVSSLGGPSGGSAVPEPASLALLWVGLPLLVYCCVRRKRSLEKIEA